MVLGFLEFMFVVVSLVTKFYAGCNLLNSTLLYLGLRLAVKIDEEIFFPIPWLDN